MPELKWPSHAGEAIALVSTSQSLTYRDYATRVGQVCLWLQGKGIGPSNCVGLFGHNSMDYAVTMMALLRTGASAAMLNARLPRSALEQQVQSIACDTVVLTDQGEADLPAGLRILKVRPALPCSTSVDLTGESLPGKTITFTSGSNGVPKAAVHTSGAHVASAIASNGNISFVSGDRWLLSLPLYHVGGMAILFRALAGGGTAVFPEPGETVPDCVQRHGVTHLSLVSTQLRRFLEDSDIKDRTASLKAVLVGGGPLPEDYVHRAIKAGLPLYTTYGLTEAGSQVTTTRPGDSREHLLTSGRPLGHVEVRRSKSGEIMLKGTSLLSGYLTGSELSRPFDNDGWFHTGDIGRFDADGYLKVRGRIDNMFISGGENIHPEEIENTLCRYPGVIDAMVVDLPDDEYGRRPIAFVRAAEDAEPDQAALRSFIATRLGRWKTPEKILAWPDGVGKEGLKWSRREFRKLAERLSSPTT